MWVSYAVVSGLLYTAQGLITRHVLKGNKHAWAFSFFFSAIGAVVSLPFSLLHPLHVVPREYWIMMVVVGALIVLQNYLNFSSARYLPASVGGALTKFRLVWVLLLGVILDQESLTWYKLLGTVCAVLAGVVILRRAEKLGSLRGIVLVISSTFVYAIVISLYKQLLLVFNPSSLTLFIFLLPAILNVIVMPDSLRRIRSLLRDSGWSVIAACVFGAFANLAMNNALSLGDSSRVLVMIESFLVVTLVFEHFMTRDRSHLRTKLVAVLLAVAGAVLMRAG